MDTHGSRHGKADIASMPTPSIHSPIPLCGRRTHASHNITCILRPPPPSPVTLSSCFWVWFTWSTQIFHTVKHFPSPPLALPAAAYLKRQPSRMAHPDSYAPLHAARLLRLPLSPGGAA